MTRAEIELDYWTQHYAEKPPGESFEDESFDLDAIVAQAEAEGEAAEAARMASWAGGAPGGASPADHLPDDLEPLP